MEGRGSMDDIAVDYISTGYLAKHLGVSRSSEDYDTMIVIGMVTRHMTIHQGETPLFLLKSTLLFRQLQELEIICNPNDEIPFCHTWNKSRSWKFSMGSFLNIL
jgi:hypothetical protein